MEERQRSNFAKDIVCGMIVNIDKAAGESSYEGKRYFFCSPGCKERFEQRPAAYIRGEIPQGMGERSS